MAQKTLAMGFLGLAITAMMFVNSSAQSGCTTTIISMASCLSYISGNSSTPSSSCCSSLASVVQNKPECLCSVLAGGASSFGITINNTKALEMPGLCKVKTPPVSECNKVNGAPGASPTAPAAPAPKESTTPAGPTAPAPKASETPATPTTPSVPSVAPAGSGSKATPSTAGTTTESSGSIKSGTASMLFVAALASFTVFLI